MSGQRPFRFGVSVWSGASPAEWAEKARAAEALGFATLLMPDHFGDQLAPVVALTAAAEATTSLRVGSFVFDNDFRHPVVLAKEAATIDLLSDGRFELGLGAGWLRSEYEQVGISFDPPPVRVDRMAEALRIIKGLLGPDPVTFQGRHYRVTGLEGRPRPLQQPHPPILVGGGGRRMLSIAAREADIVGLAPTARADGGGLDLADATAAATDRKLTRIRDAAGERFDELELNALIQRVVLTDDRRGAAEELAGRFEMPPEEVLQTPYLLIGTADQIADDLRARRERYGISYVVVFEHSRDALTPVIARLAGV